MRCICQLAIRVMAGSVLYDKNYSMKNKDWEKSGGEFISIREECFSKFPTWCYCSHKHHWKPRAHATVYSMDDILHDSAVCTMLPVDIHVCLCALWTLQQAQTVRKNEKGKWFGKLQGLEGLDVSFCHFCVETDSTM